MKRTEQGMTGDELDAWFCQLSYIEKLSLYEGRMRLGVVE